MKLVQNGVNFNGQNALPGGGAEAQANAAGATGSDPDRPSAG
jgi:hypothetical protein